jgi:hypothetical protein
MEWDHHLSSPPFLPPSLPSSLASSPMRAQVPVAHKPALCVLQSHVSRERGRGREGKRGGKREKGKVRRENDQPDVKDASLPPSFPSSFPSLPHPSWEPASHQDCPPARVTHRRTVGREGGRAASLPRRGRGAGRGKEDGGGVRGWGEGKGEREGGTTVSECV